MTKSPLARTRVGIAIASDAVRAVALRHGNVLWVAEVPYVEQGLRAALDELLDSRQMGGLLARGVTIAVGPSRSQVKQLARLPALPRPRDLARVVQAGVTRFFVHRGAPLVATGVRPTTEQGVAWAAVIDEPVVTAVVNACRDHGVRVRAIVPTLVALAGVAPDGGTSWRDGDVVADAEIANARLVQLRTRRAEGVEDAGDVFAGAPAALEPHSPRFADAYAAARLSPREPLVIDLRRQPQRQDAVPAWRVGVAAGAAAACLAGVLLLPGLRATHDAARDLARLQAIAPAWDKASAREAALAHTTASLHELASFSGARHSSVWFLGTLAHSLPPEAMLVTARFDTTGGTVVALAPRAAQVLASLEQVPQVSSPELVGPVTHEWVGTADRERATIRFRWQAAAP
jgi:hypothetical protein